MLASLDARYARRTTVRKAVKPLKDETVGRTLVRDVRVERHPDSSGEDAYYVTLVLADPPVGQDTWPLDDLRRMRGAVRRALGQASDLDATWYVVFEPEHLDLDDGRGGQLAIFDV